MEHKAARTIKPINTYEWKTKKDDNILNEKQPYVTEYIDNLLKCEQAYNSSPKNFRTNKSSRSIVVDWLINVHHRYNLSQVILHKTIALMDDYTSKKHISDNTLQLVGVSSLSLTVKNAETPISSDALVKMCDSYFTKDDLHKMEIDLLQVAKFDLNRPVSPQFLYVLHEYFNLSKTVLSMSTYFLDLWLFNQDFVKHRCSVVASAAILLAMFGDGDGSGVAHWAARLKKVLQFSGEEANLAMSSLVDLVTKFDVVLYKSVQEKYSADVVRSVDIQFYAIKHLSELIFRKCQDVDA